MGGNVTRIEEEKKTIKNLVEKSERHYLKHVIVDGGGI
jgi:hypothetical protein